MSKQCCQCLPSLFSSSSSSSFRQNRSQEAENRRIKKILKKERHEQRKQTKILLLGTGDSGKSTVMKQMKLLNGESLVTDENVDSVRFLVYKNILRSFLILIDARQTLNYVWENEENNRIAAILMQADTKQPIVAEYFRRFQFHMQSVWNDSAIQRTFERRNLFYISDGFGYLMENFERIVSKNYYPSNEDVLRCREATRMISEYSVKYRSVVFKFIDVGGQQSQRHKWLHVMDNVHSILFIVSSIEYDLHLVENSAKNRFEDSLETFAAITQSPVFARGVAFILFLNKTDMLKKKLEQIRKNREDSSVDESEYANTIDLYFSDFTGDVTSCHDVQSYIQHKFEQCFLQRNSLAQNSNSPEKLQYCASNSQSLLFCHRTVAVDTENIKRVFSDVRRIILQNNIAQLMIS